MEKEGSSVCMICLQEGANTFALECKCKLLIHSECWERYTKEKDSIECIICHAKWEKPIEKPASESSSQKSCLFFCCCCFMTQFLLQFL